MRPVMMLALVVTCAHPCRAQVLDVRDLNANQINALDRTRTVAILTGGILEEHGPYLPSYSDGFQSEFVAARVADAVAGRPGWAVLRFPSIPLGSMPASEIGGRFSFAGSYGVRSDTLRAVFMDLATDLGDAGFRWVFVVHLHGAPLHNRALDDAAAYFSETYGGRMVHLTGLRAVAGAVPRDIFTPAQRSAEGLGVHADADEHSRILFLRPNLVAPTVGTAAPQVGRTFADLAALARSDGWPGYFGTPAIASQAAGDRAMSAIAQGAVDAALRILDGAPDASLVPVPDGPNDPDFARIIEGSLEHERQVGRRQQEWISRQRR